MSAPLGHTPYSWLGHSSSSSQIPPGHTSYSWGCRRSGDISEATHSTVRNSGNAESEPVTTAALRGEDADLFGGQILYINLDRRPDRKRELLANLASLGIPPSSSSLHRIRAVDGSLLTSDQLPSSCHFPTQYWNAGAVGCLLSHLAALKHAKSANLPFVLILEDDCEFPNNAVERCNELIRGVPREEWHILYLGGNHITLPPSDAPAPKTNSLASKLNELDKLAGLGVRRVCNTLTSHAYAVHRRAYDNLITLLSGLNSPVDLLYVKYQRSHPCFGYVPSLAKQRSSKSDVVGRGSREKIVDYKFE